MQRWDSLPQFCWGPSDAFDLTATALAFKSPLFRCHGRPRFAAALRPLGRLANQGREPLPCVLAVFVLRSKPPGLSSASVFMMSFAPGILSVTRQNASMRMSNRFRRLFAPTQRSTGSRRVLLRGGAPGFSLSCAGKKVFTSTPCGITGSIRGNPARIK